MKILVYILALFILALFITNSAISKENIEKTSQKQEKNIQKDEKQEEKTVKFHKPETEAERALDEILRIKDNISDQNWGDDNRRLTKEFIKTEEECTERGIAICRKNDPQMEFMCDECLLQISCSQDYLTDIGFLYYTIPSKDNKMRIFRIGKGFKNQPDYFDGITEFKKEDIVRYISYIMKKEDGIWKLDGLCCNIPYAKINCEDI